MSDHDSEVAALRSELQGALERIEDLRREVAGLRAQVRTTGDPPAPSPPTPAEVEAPAAVVVGRRRALAGMAGAAAAVAGATVVAGGQPVAANDGDTMFVGRVNSARATTEVRGTSTPISPGAPVVLISDNGIFRGGFTGAAGLHVNANAQRFSTGINVEGQGLGIQVIAASHGIHVNAVGDGLTVVAQNRGAWLTTTEGTALQATAQGTNAYGVQSTSTKGTALWGRGATYGLVAQSTTTDPTQGAVFASTTAGRVFNGATSTGDLMYLQTETGGGIEVNAQRYQLRLGSLDTRGAPTADTFRHEAGDLVESSAGDLWLCVGAGTPGTWRKLGGPATAGAFHVLANPVRAYDSRPGGAPAAVGPKTPLPAGNVARPIDLKQGGTGVPAGATAVMVNLLLTNAAAGNGNLTVWANGAAKPQSNTLVWGGAAGRFSTLAVTKVDGQARCQIDASLSTHIVVDVVGYYR